MSRKPSPRISWPLPAAFLLAAFAVALSPRSAAAANAYQGKRAAPVTPRGYYGYRGPRLMPGQVLPYGPEYGFLRTLPPNAIQMPGYIFVPGVGIIGEDCDLPTSACPNQYRMVR